MSTVTLMVLASLGKAKPYKIEFLTRDFRVVSLAMVRGTNAQFSYPNERLWKFGCWLEKRGLGTFWPLLIEHGNYGPWGLTDSVWLRLLWKDDKILKPAFQSRQLGDLQLYARLTDRQGRLIFLIRPQNGGWGALPSRTRVWEDCWISNELDLKDSTLQIYSSDRTNLLATIRILRAPR